MIATLLFLILLAIVWPNAVKFILQLAFFGFILLVLVAMVTSGG
jgi:hypothetical protein